MNRLLTFALASLISACAVDSLPDSPPELATLRQPGTGSSGGNPEVASFWFRTAAAEAGGAHWQSPPRLHVGSIRVLFGKGGSCPASSARLLSVNRELTFNDPQPVRVRGANLCAIEFLPDLTSGRAVFSGVAVTDEGPVAVALGRTHTLRIDLHGSERYRTVDVHLDELLADIDARDYLDRELSETAPGADRNRLIRNVQDALHLHVAEAAPFAVAHDGAAEPEEVGEVSLVRAAPVPSVRSTRVAD